MNHPDPKLREPARRWLDLWRGWGKPRIEMNVSFCPVDDGEFEGRVGSTNIVLRFDGEPTEHDDFFLQPFQILVFDTDITSLVAELSGIPSDDGRLVIIYRDEWWNAMTTAAMAVQAAHCNAAWLSEDVEAMRLLDRAVASEQVAALEALILANAATPSAFSSLSKRPRL
jgi:hypothetical protein